MTTLNVPIQLRRGNEVDCPTHMLAGEVYVCLDSGKIFAGTGPSTSLKQLGGSAALWGGITGTLSNQTDLQAVLTALAAADTTEASTRAAADSANATAITTEATTRASAVSTEATARAAADATLQSNITSEASTRATADSTNATAISTETSRATTAEGLLVPKATTVNGHALSSNVVVSASDLTTGTLPHAQLPAIAEADVTNLVSDLAAKVPTTRTVAGHALSADVTLAEADITNLTTDLAAKAPLASPALTGTPTAPTAAAATNTTQLATTAFVESEIPLRSAVLSVAGKTGTVTLVESDVASLVSDLALKAPLASPALTGIATAVELDATTLKLSAASPDIILTRSAAASLAVTGSPNFIGSVQTTQLANVAACTVTPTLGSVSQWSYTVVATDAAGGTTKAAAATLISNGADTLDGTHFNTIVWSSVVGAVSYKVWRVKAGGTSPTTSGVIATVAADATLSVVDNGLAADGTNFPELNSTGNNSEPGITNQAGLAFFWGGYGPVMPIVAGANAALANVNKTQLALFYIPFAMTLNKLTVFVNAVSASANQFADFGLADLSMNLITHGQINVSSGQATGARQVAIAGTVQPGFYWFVWTSNNATDATFAVTVAVANANTIMNKTNSPFPRNGTGATTSSGALPAKLPGSGVGYPNYVLVAASLTLPYCLFE